MILNVFQFLGANSVFATQRSLAIATAATARAKTSEKLFKTIEDERFLNSNKHNQDCNNSFHVEFECRYVTITEHIGVKPQILRYEH